MRRILCAFLLTCIFCFGAVSVQAADKVWMDDEFSLASIHRLYLDADHMQYSKTAASPEIAAIAEMFAAQGMEQNRLILQKNDLDRLLLRDTGKDIGALSSADADAVIKGNLAKYVDAYVVMTIIHNSRVVAFYEVYSAQTNQLIYSYQAIAGRSDEDTIDTYRILTRDFFKNLEKSAKDQKKKQK